MSRRVPAIALAALLTVAALATPALAAEIVLTDADFEPETVEVAPGEPIVWRNTGTSEVTVVGDQGTWDSGPLAPGETFSLQLRDPGEYVYRTSGRLRQGTIVVAAAGPAEAAPTLPASAALDAQPPALAQTGDDTLLLAVLALVLLAGGTTLVRAALSVRR